MQGYPLRNAWLTFVLFVATSLAVCPYLFARDLDDASGLQKQIEELKASGYYGKAIPIMTELLAINRKGKGGQSKEVAWSLDTLGELNYLAGKYAEAEPLLQESLSIRKRIQGPDHIETAQTHDHLGALYTLMGRYDDAAVHLNEAIRIRKAAKGENSADFAETLVNQARLYISMDDRKKAASLLDRALAIQEKVLGPAHPDLVKTLNTYAWLHIDTDDFEAADSYASRALKIGEAAYGGEHPGIADSLNYLGRLYYSRGVYQDSIEATKRALAIREKFLGPEHPDVGVSYNNLALPYCGLEQYETAKGLFIKSLTIRERVLGPENPALLVIIKNTGWVHGVLGDYAGAVRYAKRALAITEKTYGPDHIEVADCQKDLAELYNSMGDREHAEPLLKSALKTYEKALGPDHTRVALALSNLAIFYHSTGDLAKAKPFYERSIEICEKNFDKAPANLANNLISLGALHADMGNYDQAEPLYQRALGILESSMGPEHSSVAYVLNNMGWLYGQLGDYEKAEPLYARALAIWEKVLGPENPNVATALDNLAMLHESVGEYKKAEPLYLRALKIRENAFGPAHPSVLKTQNNLATLYGYLGDYEKAEQMFTQILHAKENTIGTQSASYANTLSNLATFYEKKGEPTRAEPLFTRAVEIWKNSLGTGHPTVATGLVHLAGVYAQMEKEDLAYAALSSALDIEDAATDQVMGFTSEEQKLKFAAANNYSLSLFLNLVTWSFKQDPVKIKQALDVWLKRKGAILEAQKNYQEALSKGGNQESAELFQELRAVRGRLSKLSFSQPEIGDEEGYKRKIAELVEEKNRLEARLSRISKPFALEREVAKADSHKVAGRLPLGSALVEFARIESTDAVFVSKGKPVPAHRYIAFILPAGSGKQIGFADIGDADVIDGAIANFRMEISEDSADGGGISAEETRKLHEMVFAPLLKALGPVKEVFISPDGNLSLIPFEVLQGKDGRYLIEDYTFNYISAGRDIVGFQDGQDNSGRYLLVGAPDFESSPGENSGTVSDMTPHRQTGTKIAKRSVNLSDVSFAPLIHTKEELNAIGEIVGRSHADIYTGKDALEEVLTNNPSPELLHLATHGFFLSDGDEGGGAGRGWQSTDLSKGDGQSSAGIQRELTIENPLLRSGIFLAGAKRSLTTGYAGTNDGIVTAEKILGLNLQGTRMVVLSACDTGLGEVKSGEGVFGLRRAFTQAGAKSLVMSLWKVPDLETKELMVQFYRNIKTGTMNRCQALRQAALKQKEIVRERYGHTNPRYWGAFVFMGQP
ncbi:MAG: tetratricopeptide repeat protein [Pseudomonadota bacterium]